MTVAPHPDSDTLLAFREHRLAGSAVAELAVHIEQCAQCAQAELSAGATVFDALVSLDHHLSYEELDILVDGRVDDPSHRIAAEHVAVCAMCRAEVEDLQRFDADDSKVVPIRRGRSSQRWLIAAAAVFAVLALSTIALLLRRPTPEMADVGRASARPPREGRAEARPTSRVVASLADGGARIALLEDGTIAGVEPRSPRDAEDARAVLAGRSIAIPTFIAAMPGAVRGGDELVHPPRAIEPFRSAVVDARPRFSWTPVRDARSYRVAVFDENYEEVARSEALTSTSWTPSKPLPAGVDLSWHVVADTEAGEISSAGANRAEAVFRVLAAGDAAEVGQSVAAYRDSHLMRGLVYSRYGLLHDAKREFRALAKENPDSPVARALIKSVSR